MINVEQTKTLFGYKRHFKTADVNAADDDGVVSAGRGGVDLHLMTYDEFNEASVKTRVGFGLFLFPLWTKEVFYII